MFQRKLAKLSDFAAEDLEVVRDCAFYSVGKIPSRLDDRVVPISAVKYLNELKADISGIAGVICPAELVDAIPKELGVAVAEKPVAALYRIHRTCVAEGVHWQSFATRIHPTAKIHATAYVAPTDVVIGEGCVVEPNASILERTILGEHVFVGSGTVLGSPAYEIDAEGRLLPQAGGVRIGNAVVFLANVAVARSMFPLFTEIGDRCSFDNLVHVAHDCLLGRGVKLTAGTILAGRVTLGDGAYVGPNATISNGVTVEAKGTATIGSVVIDDVAEGERVSGHFAMPHRRFMRALAAQKRL